MVKFTSAFVATSLFVCSALAAPIFSRPDNVAVVARSIGTMFDGEVVEYASRSPHNDLNDKKYHHPSKGYSAWVDTLRTREHGNGGGHPPSRNGPHHDGHGGGQAYGQSQTHSQPGGGAERRSVNAETMFGREMVEYASRSPNKKYNHPTTEYGEWVRTLRTRAEHQKFRAGQHPHGQPGTGATGLNAASSSGGAERRSVDVEPTLFGREMVEYASRSPNKKYNHPTTEYGEWVRTLRTRGQQSHDHGHASGQPGARARGIEAVPHFGGA